MANEIAPLSVRAPVEYAEALERIAKHRGISPAQLHCDILASALKAKRHKVRRRGRPKGK